MAIFYAINSHRETRTELMRWASQTGREGRPFLTGRDFLDELPHLSPGIVMVEMQNVGMNAFELIEEVTRARFEFPAIAVLAEPNMAAAVACLRLGAVDVVLRSDFLSSLHEAVAKAEQVLSARMTLFEQHRQDESALVRLSPRERQVLDAVASGSTSKVIAGQLSLSVRTLECYRASMIAKLGCSTTGAAIALAVRYDIIRRIQGSTGTITGVPLSGSASGQRLQSRHPS